MDFFTADLHFGHKNILKFCNRPWSTVDEMNAGLIQNINDMVLAEDTLYVLGDVSFTSKEKTAALLQQINARMVLVIGNHDTKRKPEWWAESFDEVYDPRYGRTMPYHEFELAHLPWKEHMPGYDQREYLFEHAPAQRKDKVLLHGHVHNTWKIRDNQINVGMDVWGYYPVQVHLLRVLSQLHKMV